MSLNGDRTRVRNAISWRDALDRARGSNIRLGLSGFDDALDAVAAHEPALASLSDAALTERARAVRAARDTRPRTHTQAEIFALVREAARRALNQRPFDVQVVAALALDRGRGDRDADRGGQDADGDDARCAARHRGSWRARVDVQRLPRPPRRRVDGADLPEARPFGGRGAAGDGPGGAPARLCRRRDLRHGQGGRVRLPA